MWGHGALGAQKLWQKLQDTANLSIKAVSLPPMLSQKKSPLHTLKANRHLIESQQSSSHLADKLHIFEFLKPLVKKLNGTLLNQSKESSQLNLWDIDLLS